MDLMKLTDQFKSDYKPIIVRFEVYQKFKLECGYPKKCGELTPEELQLNGKCGLQQFLASPIKINRDGVTPGKYKDCYFNVKLHVGRFIKKM
jgi:hypothetical protein